MTLQRVLAVLALGSAAVLAEDALATCGEGGVCEDTSLLQVKGERPHKHGSGNHCDKCSKDGQNLIFLLSDGMGPEVMTAARTVKQFEEAEEAGEEPVPPNGWGNGNADGKRLPLEHIMVGQVQHRSLNTWITDSAAGITAYSCAHRSNNGWIGKVPKDGSIAPSLLQAGDPSPWKESDGLACLTTAEKAQQACRKIGVVVTSRFTHATPAGFLSHTVDREKENEIAKEIIEVTQPWVIIGGGLRHMLAQGEKGSKRKDDWDGLSRAKELGYDVIIKESEYEAYMKEGPRCRKLLLLDALSHRPYEIDRKAGEAWPLSLTASMELALGVMNACRCNFFLLMEGSRIDHALHEDDLATAVRETLEYNKAYEEGILPNIGQQTLVVGSSDHATGGVALGLSSAEVELSTPVVNYMWYPEVLAGQKASVQEGMLADLDEDSDFSKIKKAIKTNVDLPKSVTSPPSDAMLEEFTPTEWKKRDFARIKEQIEIYQKHPELTTGSGGFKIAAGRMIANKAWVDLATQGHTSVDVNLYCHATSGFGKSCADVGIGGNMMNHEVGKAMAEAVGLSGALVTKGVPTLPIE